MIKFQKDGKIIHEISLKEIEPLSYVTFEEIAAKNLPDTIIAMLFCGKQRPIYLAENIAAMRYGKIGEEMCIFELEDPATRIKCTDVWYFLLKGNIEYETYIADYICSERELHKYPKYLRIITNNLFYEDVSLNIIVFFGYFFSTFLVLVAIGGLYVGIVYWLIK